MAILELVLNNPYRVLGVYSNSPAKDKVSNKNRLIAFSRVGKNCSFPLDLSDVFGEPDRSLESINRSEQQIKLDADKLKHAFFWFIQFSPLDKAALSNLQAGNHEKAEEILLKREDDFSSLLNRSIIAYMHEDLDEAVGLISLLIDDDEERNKFVLAICGDNACFDRNEVTKLFIDTLAEEIGWQATYDLFVDNGCNYKEDDYIANKLVEEPLRRVKDLIDKYRNSKELQDIPAACNSLIHDAVGDLYFIGEILDDDDNRRRMINDEVADLIMRLASRHYKKISSVTKADYDLTRGWLDQAYDLAVGEMAKNSIRETISDLDETYKVGRQAIIFGQLLVIIDAYKNCRQTITDTISFVDQASEELRQIKMTSSFDRTTYIFFSSVVANLALDASISVFNDAQSSKERIRQGFKDGSMMRITQGCLQITRKIASLDVDDKTRERISQNIPIIESTYTQIKTLQQQISRQSSSGGCYIATMVYGDYDHPQVQVLRHFRDNVLSHYSIGRAFIRFYYEYSPAWVVRYWKSRAFNKGVKFLLNCFIWGYKRVK